MPISPAECRQWRRFVIVDALVGIVPVDPYVSIRARRSVRGQDKRDSSFLVSSSNMELIQLQGTSKVKLSRLLAARALKPLYETTAFVCSSRVHGT